MFVTPYPTLRAVKTHIAKSPVCLAADLGMKEVAKLETRPSICHGGIGGRYWRCWASTGSATPTARSTHFLSPRKLYTECHRPSRTVSATYTGPAAHHIPILLCRRRQGEGQVGKRAQPMVVVLWEGQASSGGSVKRQRLRCGEWLTCKKGLGVVMSPGPKERRYAPKVAAE